MTGDRLKISVSTEGGSTLITLDGELDLATVDLLKQAFGQATGDGATEVVVDLGSLAFIDSTGLGAFVDFHKECDGTDCTVVFQSVPDHVTRLMEITRLNELLTVR